MVLRSLLAVATTFSVVRAQNLTVSQPTRVSTNLSAPQITVTSTLKLEAGTLSAETLTVATGGKVTVYGGAVEVERCEVAPGASLEFAAAASFSAKTTVLAGSVDLKNVFSPYKLPQFGEIVADAQGRCGTLSLQNPALPAVPTAWRGEVRFYGNGPVVFPSGNFHFWHLTLENADVHFDGVAINGVLHLNGGDLSVKTILTFNGGLHRNGDEKITLSGPEAQVAVGGVRGTSIVTDVPRRGGSALLSPTLGHIDISRPNLPIVAENPLARLSVARKDHVTLLYPVRTKEFSLSKESVLYADLTVAEKSPNEPTEPNQWGRVVGTLNRIFPHDDMTLAFPVGTADENRFCEVHVKKAGANVGVKYGDKTCSGDLFVGGVYYSRPSVSGAYEIQTSEACELTAYLPSALPEFSALLECENGRVGTAGERRTGGLCAFRITDLTGLKTVALFEGDVPMGCEIRAFSATRTENNAVHVQWTTCREKNLAVYILERADDSERFVETARTAPNNEYEKESQYAKFDPTPLIGAARYRLKIVDFNGKVAYSPVVEVFIADEPGWSMVYPNPTTDGRFTFRTFVETPGWVNIRYIATTGEIVGQTRHSVRNAGVWQHTENAGDAHLPPGMYIAEVSTPTRKYHHRLLIR